MSERPSRELAALVVGFVQEVRNPLFGLSATVDALEQRIGDGGLHAEHLRVLRAQVARIAAAAEELMEYGNPRALTPAPVSPADVLRAAARASAIDALRSGVSLLVDVEAGLPPLVVDGPRLSHALAAIVRLAACVCGNGATLVLLASRAPAAVAFDVGGPWAEHVDENLFEPFRTLQGCSAGLAAAIAKRVLDEHGAEVCAADHRLGGRAFRVLLPVTRS